MVKNDIWKKKKKYLWTAASVYYYYRDDSELPNQFLNMLPNGFTWLSNWHALDVCRYLIILSCPCSTVSRWSVKSKKQKLGYSSFFSNFVRRGLELKENMIVVFMDFSMSFFYWSIVLRYSTPYFFCSLSLVKFVGIM